MRLPWLYPGVWVNEGSKPASESGYCPSSWVTWLHPRTCETVRASNKFMPRGNDIVANPDSKGTRLLLSDRVELWCNSNYMYILTKVSNCASHTGPSIVINGGAKWMVPVFWKLTIHSSRCMAISEVLFSSPLWFGEHNNFQLLYTFCTVYLRSQHRWCPSCENLLAQTQFS